MQVAILAGGLGQRLRPLTETVPKPLVAVHGRPFLDYQLRLLRRHGATRVVMMTGYLGAKIQAEFGDGAEYGLALTYSRETTPLGTGGALKLAEPLLDETFMVVNGDTYLDMDYAAAARAFAAADCDALMAVYDNPGQALAPNNVLVACGMVARYDKDDSRGLTHIDAGVYAFRRSLLTGLTAGQRYALERDLIPRLAHRGRLMAYSVGQRYYDIGTLDRLAAAAEVLK
jgi:NDP-sugar pyrophosphorylase family protein